MTFSTAHRNRFRRVAIASIGLAVSALLGANAQAGEMRKPKEETRSVYLVKYRVNNDVRYNKKPVGKIRGAVAYLYFLSQARAQRRMLVLTDPDLHRFVLNEVEGALGDGLEILHVPLPPELAAKVRAVTSRASDEMSA